MATPSVHTYRIQTRWSDFDMYGHMMNANYIELAQEARLAFAKEHIYSKGLDFIAFVRHLDVDLSLIHISEPTRLIIRSRMPSSA